jgi:hypothetical protein
MEKKVLRGLLFFGLLLLPFSIRRTNRKDWIIVFFLKGFTSSLLDTFLTKKKKVSYPKRFLPHYFEINVLFDYLLFPITCVFFNQTTYHSNFKGILLKAFLFSLPMTIVEVLFEKYTKLITFKNNWTSWHTLFSEMISFIATRLFIGLLRKYSK